MVNTSDPDLLVGTNAVCGLVQTTLGPFGANKLIVENDGTVTTTSVGSQILNRIDVADPAVSLLRQAAADFEGEHGAGTTSVVTLTSALLNQADDLLELGFHPTTIERGFNEACAVANERVQTRSYPLTDVSRFDVARTAMTGIHDQPTRWDIAEMIDDVAENLLEAHGEEAFDHDRVDVFSRYGGAYSNTELVRGIVLEALPVNDSMPREAQNIGVALVSDTVDFPGLTTDTDSSLSASFDVDSYEEQAAIRDGERQRLHDVLQAAVDEDCRFIATRKTITDRVQSILASHGILAVHRVDDDEFDRLTQATGATVLPSVMSISAEALGTADVSVERLAGRDMTFVRSTGGAPIYTLLCRAPDPRSVSEFEHAVKSGVAAVAEVTRNEYVVPGGGAIEVSTAHQLRDHAQSIAGREQFPVEAFADSLTRIPQLIANNAGMDGQSALTRLHVAHSEQRHTIGVDVVENDLRDVLSDPPIIEPAALKTEIISAATELTVKLLRIDERLQASGLGTDGDS